MRLPTRARGGDAPTRRALGGDLAPATTEPAPAARRVIDVAVGAAVLAAFTALGRASGHVQTLVPSTVAGFLLLTVALVVAERRPAWRRRVAHGVVPVARLLIRHMGLLFVPAGVTGLRGLLDLPSREGLAVATALLVSTLLGLAATALVTGWRRA